MRGDRPFALIYAVTSRIPRGRVATYGQIARLASLPGHARQVGYAMAALQDESHVPWHRVVNARGRISPRSGGGDMGVVQRLRLEREGVRFDAGGAIALARFRWRPRALSGLALTIGLLLLAPGVPLRAADSQSVRCGGAEYSYLLSSPGKSEPMPAILLLHGAGGHPERLLLAQRGFSVRYVELKGHDHDYLAMAPVINGEAWSFLEPLTLPTSPSSARP